MQSVSVVVPTFQDGERLEECLEALRRQSYPAELVELLFIDNTPDFQLRDRGVAFTPARLLHEPRPGSYAARNRGIRESSGDILAFTDADCLPYPDWIEQGVRALERYPDGALIAGRIEVFVQDPRRPTAVELFEIGHAFRQEIYARDGKYGATANVFVTRGLIEKTGPFMDELRSGGDKEFGKRVYAAGFPVVYSSEAAVRHPARRQLSALLGKTRRIARGVRDLERIRKVPRDSSFRGVLWLMLPPVQESWATLRNPSIGNWSRRLRAASILVTIRYYRAFYRLWFVIRNN